MYLSLGLDLGVGDVDLTPPSLSISTISEDIVGSCEYEPAGTCTANSTYSVVVSNNTGIIVYLWEIVGVGVSVASGQGTDTVVITSDNSDASTAFNLKCTVTDDTDNATTNSDFTHTRTEVPDTTIPVITRLGTNPIEVTVDTTYTDPGATALDDRDGDITANIVTNNPVNINVIGAYVVVYNVDDAAGNSAIQVTRTVNVVASVDNTPPIYLMTEDLDV